MCLGRAHRHAIPYRGKLPLAEPLHLTPQISGHFHRLCRATPHTLLVCVHVSVEELGGFGIGRARGVGVCQQRLNGCQNGVDREDGGPPVLDDVQAQGAVTVDYGRPNDQSMYTTTKVKGPKGEKNAVSTSQDAAMQREAGERAGTGGDQDHGPRTTSNKCKRKRPPVFHSTPSTPYANPATNNAPLGWNIWHVKRTRGGFSGYCSLKVRRSAYTPPETNHPNHQPNAEPDAHKTQGSKGPRPCYDQCQ